MMANPFEVAGYGVVAITLAVGLVLIWIEAIRIWWRIRKPGDD
jgi:hypothetical protein